MSNVFVIGDLHLKGLAPISRCDNYPIAILKKIEYLAGISKSCKCNTFILLGDVFDSPVTSLQYLANVINTFRKVSESGITVYTIVGNHDIKNNRMDNLPFTALGILISTGYVKLAPRDLKIENTVFKFFNYPEDVTPKLSGDFEVCIAHRYYEFGLSWDSFHEEDVINLNYDAMILGHLHVPCDTIEVGNTTLYRPGSLSRSTSEPYNKLRTPRALLFNCENHKATYVEVMCSPANKIFVSQIDGNNKEVISMKDLINFITTSYNSADVDIREYFSKLDIPYGCKEKITKYLDNIGA